MIKSSRGQPDTTASEPRRIAGNEKLRRVDCFAIKRVDIPVPSVEWDVTVQAKCEAIRSIISICETRPSKFHIVSTGCVRIYMRGLEVLFDANTARNTSMTVAQLYMKCKCRLGREVQTDRCARA